MLRAPASAVQVLFSTDPVGGPHGFHCDGSLHRYTSAAWYHSAAPGLGVVHTRSWVRPAPSVTRNHRVGS